MHPSNIHSKPYNFEVLTNSHDDLKKYLIKNKVGLVSIDFSKPEAVYNLNKALLKAHYGITEWSIPEGYLCPPIPGRADYIHHLNDLINSETSNTNIKGIDIGVGANCIYPILGAQIYNWDMVGSDINNNAIQAANSNVNLTKGLSNRIEIRHQDNNANLFEGVILKDEFFSFSMCNPPFYTTEDEAIKSNLRKLKNLNINKHSEKNFGGRANELWCNGGEALFIKRMIKQSNLFKKQVGWFTTLVSKKEHLAKIYKQLSKLKATYRTINMSQGNKQSRIVAWSFINTNVVN